MKNNQKMYYRALWGCLAVVVIAGGVYYFAGRDNTPPTPPAKQQEAHQVIVNNTPSLQEVAQVDTEPLEDVVQVVQEEMPEIAPVTAQTEKPLPEETFAEAPPLIEEEISEEVGIFESEPLFIMPLAGNIVMDYSVDHAIYDATLDQYRTNDHISIGAKKGDAVKAAEDGTVESIETNDERGVTVVLNHGNGWQTTYSQLQQDVVVEEGDTVKKGQEIGAVGDPTKYSVALGEHMDFSIAKDGKTVDPKKTVVE